MPARLRRRRSSDALFVFGQEFFRWLHPWRRRLCLLLQDEVCLTLVVWSAATLRVSNHEAVNSRIKLYRTAVASCGIVCARGPRIRASSSAVGQESAGMPY